MTERVHLFDVDFTVIKKTTAGYFIKTALKQRIIRFSQISSLLVDLIKYKMGFPDIDFIENTVKKLSGIKKSDLERIAEKCFFEKMIPDIYIETAKLIRNALKKGERVLFATSTFDFLIKPLEVFFGIENSLASKMEYVDGKTTGNLDGYSCFGKKKKTASIAWMERESIRPENVTFYSDSYTDIPLLEYCGKAVAINPDKTLKRYAQKCGWEILYFKEVLGKITLPAEVNSKPVL